jgi:hypothetical protein
MKTLNDFAVLLKAASAIMNGFLKAASRYMNGFPKAACWERFRDSFKIYLFWVLNF